ncbi:SDR family NAD(P)-dependent oxidoreductase [Paludibacterium purpuratum]|uniref:NAD(P)-dependent dehydrogenase (Short-subunit alcohol dehydrogenase family) n=1 Tax=Paludibacterium purpuratum TaxID=1144873 RepID=A0A4R7B6G6_9NEIS|nr:SDR family oxidoreductase [Paludibacterium purpuratum]TDR80053.1 NAD(P)-dependent dehydrogenase (short-subunit alcohol dehydrogenase family) [Paludibacterium purpuratum]
MTHYASYPSLAGKTVFISGGSSGIGADLVRAFARQGARVAFTGRDAAAADKVVAAADAVGPRPLFLACDMTDVEQIRQAFQQARAALGPIQALINNAANDDRHRLQDVTLDYFEQMSAINLRAHFFATQCAAADMTAAGAGVIVNLSSISWKIKGAGYPVYETCKSAMIGLTRALARDLGKQGVRVNTLTPGWVMTDKQLRLWVDANGERMLDDNQCLPGRLQGEDIANMALFLTADDSRMITAQEFVVDAGWT